MLKTDCKCIFDLNSNIYSFISFSMETKTNMVAKIHRRIVKVIKISPYFVNFNSMLESIKFGELVIRNLSQVSCYSFIIFIIYALDIF